MKSRLSALIGSTLLCKSLCAAPPETAVDAVDLEYPTVITPTRLRQSLQDVPASVTVITSQTIRAFGLSTIPEVLRLVPGMQITEAVGSWYQVNYHGTNSRNPRRMNVFVDGISVYRPGLPEIYWTQLPVAVEDIDRIEVTRGPNSAAYGPNSMLATINIITKHPRDAERAVVVLGTGSQQRRLVYGRGATMIGNTAAYISVSAEKDEGYDWISSRSTDHDTTSVKRIAYRSHTPLGDSASLQLQAAYVEGTNEIPFTSAFETFPDKKLRDYYLGATLTQRYSDAHELQIRVTHSDHTIRQEWTSCFPRVAYVPELATLYRANPAYANSIILGQIPRGGSSADDALARLAIAAVRRLGASALQPLCGLTNQNITESRGDLEIQDTYVVSNYLRIVGGVGARFQRAESATFLGGSASNTLYRAFGNIEYKPAPLFNINLGSYVEHDSLVGRSFAPRLAVNTHLSANQTLRFVISKGTRTPAIEEEKGDISYTVQTQTPAPDGTLTPRFYQSVRAPGGLQSEQVVSHEIGYLVNVQKFGLLFDVKVFNDKLKNLISETLDVSSYHPTSTNSVTLSGAEFQTSFSPSVSWNGFINYAYLRNHSATTPIERSQYSRHSGSLGISHVFPGGWQSSAAYYGASGDGEGESSYGRLDLTLSKAFAVRDGRVQAKFRLSRLDSASTSYFLRLGRAPGESRFNDRLQLAAEVKATF